MDRDDVRFTRIGKNTVYMLSRHERRQHVVKEHELSPFCRLEFHSTENTPRCRFSVRFGRDLTVRRRLGNVAFLIFCLDWCMAALQAVWNVTDPVDSDCNKNERGALQLLAAPQQCSSAICISIYSATKVHALHSCKVKDC